MNAFVPQYLWGIGSRTPSDTKIHGCSSPTVGPLYPGVGIQGFNQSQMEISILGWLVESLDGKPMNTEDRLYIY